MYLSGGDMTDQKRAVQKRRVKAGFAELRRELEQLPGDTREYKAGALKWLTESEYQAIAAIDDQSALDRLARSPRPKPL